jgi:hypothetical protein
LAGAEVSGWIPIPDFNRTDADVSMFLLAPNSVLYSHPNVDPFFSATTELNTTITVLDTNTQLTYTFYDTDHYVYMIGCTDQYQICNSAKPGSDGEPTLCTPLGPIFPLLAENLNISLNDYQSVTATSLILSLNGGGMSGSVDGLGSSALKVQESIINEYSGPLQVAKLPNNQWQSEVRGWFAMSLVSIQQALVEKARGPTDVIINGGTIVSPGPSDYSEQAICKRQMIRNVNGYQNFSTLGVVIILVVGIFLVILGWTVDIVWGSIQKRLGRDHARLSWISDGYLQLQRMAFEGSGYTDWEGRVDDVPVTNDLDPTSQRINPLNIDDSSHPRIGLSATAPTAVPMSDISPNFDERTGYEGTPPEKRPMLRYDMRVIT